MKHKGLVSLLLLAAAAAPASRAAVVTTDPLLMTAVITQTELLEKQYKERNKMLAAVTVAETAVAGAMAEVHNVENTILEYMGNASGVLKNAAQLRRIAELVAMDIPRNLAGFASEIPDNLVGTGVAMYMNRTITNTWADIAALSATVTELVQADFDFKKAKNEDGKKHVNLLSAAERFQILNDVVLKLEKINSRLYYMKFYVHSYGWKSLWTGLDYRGYINFLVSKNHVNNAISQWKRLCR